MTCAHVLGLIDAGPFADYPRAHLESAWRHARQCATCGPAMEAATSLPMDLAALRQVAASAELTTATLARIARTEQGQTAPVSVTMPAIRPRSLTRDWSAWATTLAGLAVGLVTIQSMAPGRRSVPVAKRSFVVADYQNTHAADHANSTFSWLPAPATKATCRERSSDFDGLFLCTVAPSIAARLPLGWMPSSFPFASSQYDGVHEAALGRDILKFSAVGWRIGCRSPWVGAGADAFRETAPLGLDPGANLWFCSSLNV